MIWHMALSGMAFKQGWLSSKAGKAVQSRDCTKLARKGICFTQGCFIDGWILCG